MNNDRSLANQQFELPIIGPASDCAYLPGRKSQMEFRLVRSLAADRYSQLLARGWRRFGTVVFRPVCQNCHECQGLRVWTEQFRPSKSQRRCRNRNQDLTVSIRPPTVSAEHLTLFNRYHADMSRRREWPENQTDPEQYFESFLDGRFSFSCEFQYRLNGQLVGLGLVDITDDAMSSLYFYHEPDLRDRALGTFSVLTEIQEAANRQIPWLYLGYYIADCGSMNYKNRFGPHQILQSFCRDHEAPDWTAPPMGDGTATRAGI